MDKPSLFSEYMSILQKTPLCRSSEQQINIQVSQRLLHSSDNQNNTLQQSYKDVFQYSISEQQKQEKYNCVFSTASIFLFEKCEDPQLFQQKEVNILSTGIGFGVLTLINYYKRKATVIAKDNFIFAFIKKHHNKSISYNQDMAQIQNQISFFFSFLFFNSLSIILNLYLLIFQSTNIQTKYEFYIQFYVFKKGDFQVLSIYIEYQDDFQLHNFALFIAFKFLIKFFQ
ncbi:unnamed protein product [Paramecium sonneborni]|uniref:Transmembrane protein n=1 Tax=Paramecium sonneborni TaxID=65129 RepID=A0A8S1RKL4_9CILI|nr:unnamed protein product [Paramecium sonneborni]